MAVTRLSSPKESARPPATWSGAFVIGGVLALIRIAVDLEIDESPTMESLKDFEKSMYQFAEGVASETLGYTVTEKSVECKAHVHESSSRYVCESCTALSEDEKN